MVVDGWLARAAASRPEHTALQTPAGSWTYAQLSSAACSGAAQLAVMGAVPGTRIGIALPGGLHFAQALHACLLLGAVAVPIDLRLSGEEQARILTGCEVTVDESLGSESNAPRALGLDGGHDLDATAVVIHTSGTTSAPKPVELTYGNLLWSALGSAVALGVEGGAAGRRLAGRNGDASRRRVSPGFGRAPLSRSAPKERWLCALPLSHVGGLSILVRSAIYATTAVVHDRFDTDVVLNALRKQNITLVSLVATTLTRLLDAGLSHPPALRCALTGGGPVPAALVERAQDSGVPVSLTYGLTEACSQVTTTPVAALNEIPAHPAPSHLLSAGPPLFCTRVQTASDGEIMVAGPTVVPGSADGDGWLRTGDLGAIGEDGRLRVTGRKAEVIISGGENIAPAEVEAVLEAHPDVLEAAVLGRPDPRWGEAVTAIVVARPGALLEGEALRAHCARGLAPHKVPKQVSFVREPLPRTRSGKLLRKELI
jgi:O-succinylbenzoic acid--CoA ligase